MQDFWNARYAENEYVYGTEPNDYFQNKIKNITPGTLLLPAEGEGRNAVYAATQGWTVTAFDYSTEAKNKAELLAANNGVEIAYSISTVDSFQVAPESMDAVGLFYVHLPEEQRKLLHQKCIDVLKPGGTLILEAFNPRQLHFSSGGPKNPDWLYTKKMLADDFKALKMLEIQEIQVFLNEGDGHKGEAAVIRMMATKP